MVKIIVAFGFLCIIFSAAVFAGDIPIFDGHVHYSEPDWSVYSPEAILKQLDQARVKWAMVSSTPDEGTIRLFDFAPDWIFPVLRPYRTRADMGSWTEDVSILSYVEKRLEKGIYRGIGEFHLSANQTGSPVVRRFAHLSEQRGLFLHAHTDDAGVVSLLRLYPKGRILWAHAGMSAEPEKIRPLLDQYPKLYVELSLRDSDIAPGGRLGPSWRDLFVRHGDRFVVGSDTWVTSRWESFSAIHSVIRAWLNQLPRDVAEKIAFKNGLVLVRPER